jgi:hypothetical protein
MPLYRAWLSADSRAGSDTKPTADDLFHDLRRAAEDRLCPAVSGASPAAPIRLHRQIGFLGLVVVLRAETEITALVLAMAEAMEALRAEGQTTWQWADAERVHAVSKDDSG